MGFKFHTSDPDAGWEYFPASAINTHVGTALIQNNGLLEIASGDVKPTYISMHESGKTLESGKIIPVMRVSPDAIYECDTTENMTTVNVGDKVTISADGNSVTSTSGAHVEVVAKTKTSYGTTVRVRFE